MIKITENHYLVKLFNEMRKYGMERMRIGDITATLQYPEDNINVFTLSLINFEIKKGVVFNILRNYNSTIIIESKVCGSEVWFEQQATLSSATLL